jgi:hypothetical protein
MFGDEEADGLRLGALRAVVLPPQELRLLGEVLGVLRRKIGVPAPHTVPIAKHPRDARGPRETLETLFEEPFLAVVGTSNKLTRKRYVELADLVTEPWIMPPYDSVPGSMFLRIFHSSNLKPPQPAITTLSAQLTVTLIASGKFVGMLPSSVARFNERAGLQTLPLTLPAVHIAASLVTVKNRTLSPAARLFVKWRMSTQANRSAQAEGSEGARGSYRHASPIVTNRHPSISTVPSLWGKRQGRHWDIAQLRRAYRRRSNCAPATPISSCASHAYLAE